MKCKLTEKKRMKVMLIVGLILTALGSAAAFFMPDEAHLATRVAGFAAGLGFSLAVMSGAVLIRRRRLGEARAKDVELAMTDERGLAVAYKAQNVAAVAAVFAMIALMIAALVRGDDFYAMMGSFLLCAVALVKLAAWYFYNKTM